ncbi:hypothetical protein ACFPRL_05580 [Pseudoclavibacter helvolus]
MTRRPPPRGPSAGGHRPCAPVPVRPRSREAGCRRSRPSSSRPPVAPAPPGGVPRPRRPCGRCRRGAVRALAGHSWNPSCPSSSRGEIFGNSSSELSPRCTRSAWVVT